MAYESQEWVTGQRITAEKLNHMEQGIANSGGGTALIVNDNSDTLDRTWKEIDDALQVGIPAYVSASAGAVGGTTRRMAPIVQTEKTTDMILGNSSYSVYVLDVLNGTTRVSDYYTDTEDGFPAKEDGPGPA